ncbi:MAG TPA: protease pro-enzyme activation domain-containing protein, partial [Opitutaceae bacterium]|nr:protease pro-enzyme activation domain-containing protein [Opitutaceae bacterium]
MLAAFLLAGATLPAQNEKEARVSLPDSIVEIPALTHFPAAARPRPTVVRTALTAGENAEELDIEFALRMRDFEELQARVQRGELIPPAEMAAKYYPLAADHDVLLAWLLARGFTVTRTDPNHLAIFARGKISLLREALRTDFARVAYEGAEFSSAVSAPTMPAGLAAPLLGINGLQPHLRPHRHTALEQYRPLFSNRPPYSPAEILRTYGG